MEAKPKMENMEGLKGKRIIITGGAGFIASHLVEELLLKQATVLAVDIIVHPSSYFAKKELQKKTQVALFDITDRGVTENIFKEFKPDYIFHLAAQAIVESAYQDPYSTFQINIMGTVSVLEAAKKVKAKGIIVASSDKAYGKTKEAYTEASPLQGDHPYDVSKSCTDLIAQTYYKTYGMPIVITRFGNVYGEGDLHLNRIIPGICESIITKKPLLIRSNGKYIRDYIYVKDVANGYLFLLNHLRRIKGEAFNISSEETYSVIDLLKKSEKMMQKKIPYKIMSTAKNEIPYQHLDCTKIKKLGWKTQFTFPDVFQNVLEWYKGIV
jgi:CDP-glucose 4,6-dehydratase